MLYWEGAAYVFIRQDGVWSETQKLLAADGTTADYFGAQLILHGNHMVIGAHGLHTGRNLRILKNNICFILLMFYLRSRRRLCVPVFGPDVVSAAQTDTLRRWGRGFLGTVLGDRRRHYYWGSIL